jgi:hypothetical protein
MAQFKTHVPHPLRQDLPKFLSTGCLRDPTVRVLLLIFIGKNGLECSSVEIEVNDIGRGKSDLG